MQCANANCMFARKAPLLINTAAAAAAAARRRRRRRRRRGLSTMPRSCRDAMWAISAMAFASDTDAYLLVAQPKASSTSVMLALSQMTDIKGYQDLKANVVCNRSAYGFQLTFFHADYCNVRSNVILSMANSQNRIFKQHFPPTDNNIQSVLQAEAVVLLRNPWSAVEADCQAMRDMRCVVRCTKPHDLEISFLSYLSFYHGWAQVAKAHPDRILIITFEQMFEQGRNATLMKALAFWGLPIQHPFHDVFSRYSLHNSNRSCAQDLQKLPSLENLTSLDPVAWQEYTARNDEMRGGVHSTPQQQTHHRPQHAPPPPPALASASHVTAAPV